MMLAVGKFSMPYIAWARARKSPPRDRSQFRTSRAPESSRYVDCSSRIKEARGLLITCIFSVRNHIRMSKKYEVDSKINYRRVSVPSLIERADEVVEMMCDRRK